jgi:hypothetical protein
MITEKNGVETPEILANPQTVVQSPSSGREKGLRKNFLDTTNLVRSIQRAEGNPDCFRKAKDYCDRMDCTWRSYCLREKGPYPEEAR